MKSPSFVTTKTILPVIIITLAFSCKSVQTQGIQGTVQWISGNQMPGPNKNKSTSPKAIVREIRIYPAIYLKNVQGKEGSFFPETIGTPTTIVTSAADGTFKAALPPGTYSIFTKEERGLFANQYDGNGCINCVEVRANEFTPITIRVDYEAAY